MVSDCLVKSQGSRLKRNMLLYFQVGLNQFDISCFWQLLTPGQTCRPLSLMGSIVSGGATGRSAYRINTQCVRVEPDVYCQDWKACCKVKARAAVANLTGTQIQLISAKPLLITSWF